MVGSSITLVALSDTEGAFEGWYENDQLISNDLTYTYNATNDNKTIAARFKFSVKKDVRAQTYVYDAEQAIWKWIDSNEGGTFTITHSGGTVYTHAVVGYEKGVVVTSDPVTFEATANNGYEFIGWWNNLKGVFTDNPWFMERPEEYDQSVTARFAKRGELNVDVENHIGGMVAVTYNNGVRLQSDTTEAGTYNTLIESVVTLEAIADDKYMFDGWYENGTFVTSENPYTFTATDSKRTIVAIFNKVSTPTYLENNTISTSDVYKLFLNGQLYIYNQGKRYTVMGQEL
jgi:hypothetical protein